MSHVSQNTLALANLISIGLAALVSGLLSKDGAVVPLRRKYFAVFLAVDAFAYGAVSYLGLYVDVSYRFIGMAIAEALFTSVTFIIMRDALNLVLSGSKLTAYQNHLGMLDSLTGFTALSVFMLVDIEMSIEFALEFQFVALCVSAVTESLFIASINRREKAGLEEEEGS